MTRTIECHRCHRELPESSYYPSVLNRGNVYCKDCCKEWNKPAKKRYMEKLKETKKHKDEEVFNSMMGGFIINMLYNPKEGEFKYSLTETKKGNTFFMNDPDTLKQLFLKALKDTENGQKKN